MSRARHGSDRWSPSSSWGHAAAPANAPAGGGGMGFFRDAISLGSDRLPVLHQRSPASKLKAELHLRVKAPVRIEYASGASASALEKHTLEVLFRILDAAKAGTVVVSKVMHESKKQGGGSAVQVIDIEPSASDRASFMRAVTADKGVRNPQRLPGQALFRVAIPQPEKIARHVAEAPPPEPPPPPKKKQKTWVEFKVLEEGTNRAVRRLRLRIMTPDGNENYYTTNAEGLVRIEPVDEGKCEVKCDLKEPKLDNTFHFVRLAKGKAPASTEQPLTANGIALVESHKVKAGETLDSLAKSVGLSWKDLAKFNWNTDKPAEINVHLRDAVGCTKRTKDGKNYIFDDSDQPGTLFLPKPWIVTARDTTDTHLIYVRKIVRPLDVVIPLEMDIDGDPLQDDEVRLQSDDGKWTRVLFASDPDVTPDLERRFLLYRFRAVPPGLYHVAVCVGGQWIDVHRGLRVKEDAALTGTKELPKELPSEKAAKLDDTPIETPAEPPETDRIGDLDLE